MNIFTIFYIAFRRVIFDGIDDDDKYDETDNLISSNDDDNYEDSDIENSKLVDFSLQSKTV